jgi:hypothetical protein
MSNLIEHEAEQAAITAAYEARNAVSPAAKRYVTTVHIMLDVMSEPEACDALTGLLTERGIYGDDSGIADWEYRSVAGVYSSPVLVDVPAGWDRHEDTIQELLDASKPQKSVLVAQAKRAADEVSAALAAKGRVPAAMVEDLRNHVRKLAAALEETP